MGTAPGKPWGIPVLPGDPNSARATGEGGQAGEGRWHGCSRGSRAWDMCGQMGRKLSRKRGQSICGGDVVPHISPVPAAGARE